MSRVSSSQRSLADLSNVPTVWLQTLVRFSVEGKRFKISPHRIYEESPHFTEKYLSGRALGTVIVLEDVTASQWSTFMELLSPRLSTFNASLAFIKVQWIDILRVATIFRFDRFRKMAMYRLGELLFDPLEAIVLGRQAYFSDWVLKAYDILVRREAPITEEESEVIGHLTTVRLFNIRHNLHWELGHCRDDPPTDAEAEGDECGDERDEEPADGVDDPITLSEVDDVVRECLLKKFKEEFALIEEEETKRHYSEYEEDSEEEEEQEKGREEDADDKEDAKTTTRSKLLDGDEEEALEEYLNREDDEDKHDTSLSSASAGLRSPWNSGRLDVGGVDYDDDEHTRVGSQRSEVGDSWSEGGEDDSPVNSVSSGERFVCDEDEAGVHCFNLLGYDSPPLQSSMNALGIDFATLSNFRSMGELGVGGRLEPAGPTSGGTGKAEVFRRPVLSRGEEAVEQRQTMRQFGGSPKEGRRLNKASEAGNSNSHQGVTGNSSDSDSEEEDADAGSRDDTLCRVA